MFFSKSKRSSSDSSSNSSAGPSSSPTSSSSSRIHLLSLTPIGIPNDPSNLSAYLSAAQLLIEDFDYGDSSSGGWKEESPHGLKRTRVAVCRGSKLRDPTQEVVDPSATWIGRRSVHGPEDGSWEDFQNLLKDSEGTGSQWISDLKGIEVLSSFEPSTLPAEVHSAAVVHLYHLAMPAPLQGRTFLSFVLTATPSNDCFWNVSVPLEDEDYIPGEGDEEGRVRARQVSVERVRRVGQEIEWTFVHAFVLGGSLPQRAVDSKMSKKCADDIQAFLRWLKSKP